MKSNLNVREKISFFILIIGFFILQFVTLKDGHNWGDDFSQYILQALRIAFPGQYPATYDLNPWKDYPWGFPLLLAPLVKVFGVNYLILKIPNIFYWFIFTVGLWKLAQRYLSSSLAILVAIIFLTSPYLFVFKQNILSDLAFMAVVIWSVYFFTVFYESKEKELRHKEFWISLLLGVFACFIRYPGFFLLATMAVYLLVNKKYRRLCFAVIMSVFLCLLVQFALGSSAYSYVDVFSHYVQHKTESADFLAYTIKGLVIFFVPFRTSISKFFFQHYFFALWFVGLSFIFLAISWFRKREIVFYQGFTIFYFLMVLIWGVEQGVRYLFLIEGFVLLMLLEGVSATIITLGNKNTLARPLEILSQGVLCILIFHNIISLVFNYHFNDNLITSKKVTEAVEWTKKQTLETDRFMFFHPRIWGLLTQRSSVAMLEYKDDTNVLERVKKFNVDYLVLLKPEDVLHIESGLYYFPDETMEQLAASATLQVDQGRLFFIKKYGLDKNLQMTKAWENDYIRIYKIHWDGKKPNR